MWSTPKGPYIRMGSKEEIWRALREEISGIKEHRRNIHGGTWGQVVRKDVWFLGIIFRELVKNKFRWMGWGLVIEDNWKTVPTFIQPAIVKHYILQQESDIIKWNILGKLNGCFRKNSPVENFLSIFCFLSGCNENSKYEFNFFPWRKGSFGANWDICIYLVNSIQFL